MDVQVCRFWVQPIQLMGHFEVYPSICWVTNLIMSLYHFIFLGLPLAFLYHKVSYHYEMY
jgi:hypothetical protein